MKKVFLVLGIAMLFGCNPPSNQQQNYQQTQQPVQVTVNATPTIGDNLNLQALGELVKQSSTPQDIENALNNNNTINNLDLNGDGDYDILAVTETNDGGIRTYSVIDTKVQNQPVVATVQINTQTNTLVLNGNPQYYGNNGYYQTPYDPSTFLLMAYLLRPHYPYYHSPYHYGYYGNYRPYRVSPYNTYHNSPHMSSVRTRTPTTTTTVTHNNNVNVNNNNYKNTNAPNHANISSPTQSQKQFQVRDQSKPIGSGGFNSKPSTPSTYKAPTSTYKAPTQTYHSSPSPSSRPSSSSGGHSGSGYHHK